MAMQLEETKMFRGTVCADTNDHLGIWYPPTEEERALDGDVVFAMCDHDTGTKIKVYLWVYDDTRVPALTAGDAIVVFGSRHYDDVNDEHAIFATDHTYRPGVFDPEDMSLTNSVLYRWLLTGEYPS